MTGELKVGQFDVSFMDALDWTRAYLDADRNRGADKPFAYPAYDEYDAEHNDPSSISDSDLLAPVLLNVGISIGSFYGLQQLREPLSGVLRDVGDTRLTDSSDAEIVDLVGRAYEVLDDGRRPPGIGGTKLSKVLHRKRPDFFVLHDSWVQRCYLGTDAVPKLRRGERRTWAEYMALFSIAIRGDLTRQLDTWTRLLSESSPDGSVQVTLVRLLDIVAWNAGRRDAGGVGSAPLDDDDEATATS